MVAAQRTRQAIGTCPGCRHYIKVPKGVYHNDKTWLDMSGNFHSEAMRLVERYTLRDADTIQYEVTVQDSKVFSRPWKMSMPLYRRVEKDGKILEYKCVEFAEELLYGFLRKKSNN